MIRSPRLDRHPEPNDLMRNAGAKSLSIVIPAFNDAENIALVVDAARAMLDQLTEDRRQRRVVHS